MIQRTVGSRFRSFFVVGIPLVYLMGGLLLGWIIWQQHDRLFAVRMGNFLVQGRWHSDEMLRDLADLRIDSRYGYFPLGEPQAVRIVDTNGVEHFPSVLSYKEVDVEQFVVYLSQGLELHFFSFDEGFALDVEHSEMPYQAQMVSLRFVPHADVSIVDDGLGVRFQLGAQNYAVEGDFEISTFNFEQNEMQLIWMDEIGFDRLQISSNLFGQPKEFSQWLEEAQDLLSFERYDSVVQRYLSRALPFFEQRYNPQNGLWRDGENREVFNLEATLTQLWQAQSRNRVGQFWDNTRSQNLLSANEFPLWLTPMSGDMVAIWAKNQRTFAVQERAWQQVLGDSSKLFVDKHLYTEMALKAPLLLNRTTVLARTVNVNDTPNVILNKIDFLMGALTNQSTNENLLAIQRQLEALEKHLVFLKKGIYLLHNDTLLLGAMLEYADVLRRLEQLNVNMNYLKNRPIQQMRESLIFGALDFANSNGEIPTLALWQEGRPQVGEVYWGLEHFFGLFYDTFALPQVHLVAVGREQRILSIADDATLRTMSDTLLQLTVQYKGRDTHYLVLTHLVRPVLGVSLGGQRLNLSSNLNGVNSGYFYDAVNRLLFVKLKQSNDVETLRIEIEAPPPPPPKVVESPSVNTPAEATPEEVIPIVAPIEPENSKKKRR